MRAHFPALDGIRGIAVLLVVIAHGFRIPATEIGFAGVDLFFVLSGFLITGILLDTRESPQYFRNFYARRVLRIFPLYYATLAVLLWLGPAEHQAALESQQAWHWTYLVNVQIARPGVGALPLTGHFWSLAVEEQFYLVWPLIIAFCARAQVRRFAWAVVIGVALLRVGLLAYEYVSGLWLREAIYVLTFTRADALSMGALIAIYARDPAGVRGLRRYVVPMATVSVAAVVTIWLRNGRVFYVDRDAQLFGFTALGIGASALVIVGLTTNATRVARVLQSRLLRFFGKYSYAIYVVHPIVGYLVAKHLVAQAGTGVAGRVAYFIATSVGAVLAALISWTVLERPILSLKRYFEPSAATPPRKCAESLRTGILGDNDGGVCCWSMGSLAWPSVSPVSSSG